MRPLGLAATTVGIGAMSGVAALGYALWEARQYTLRETAIPVLDSGADVRVLHISDLHLTGHTREREDWVQSLASLQPDLVVATGDFLSSAEGIDRVPVALGGLLDIPGVFVFGSNDLYPARVINPTKYLRGPSKRPRQVGQKHRQLDHSRLHAILTDAGWYGLNNDVAQWRIKGHLLSFLGTGDAHHRLDRYPAVAGRWDCAADVRIGVTHAPYLRVLDAMSDDGAQVIFAGHTHGGQVCLPGYGALVTNCDLDTERVKGLSRHRDSWLHVSAGLGTNPYTPIRVACRPEASLVTLTRRL